MPFQPPPSLPDLNKLIPVLQNSGIQKDNPPLYQVIWNLIKAVQQGIDVNAAKIENLESSNGNGSANSVPGLIQQVLLESDVCCNDDILIPGLVGPQGLPGLPGPIVFLQDIEIEDIPLIPGPQGASGSSGGGSELAEQTTTSIGTQNDFSLDGENIYLRCNNASALTFTGFTIGGSTPTTNAIVIIENVGTSTVRVTHQDTGSTASNRCIGISTAGQIIGANGRMQCIYDVTTGRWRIGLLETGSAITHPYASADYFGGGSMTWTVESADLRTYIYRQYAKILELIIDISGSTTGGTAHTDLNIKIPSIFTLAQIQLSGSHWVWDAGVDTFNQQLIFFPSISTTHFTIRKRGGGNFTLGTNNVDTSVTWRTPIQ